MAMAHTRAFTRACLVMLVSAAAGTTPVRAQPVNAQESAPPQGAVAPPPAESPVAPEVAPGSAAPAPGSAVPPAQTPPAEPAAPDLSRAEDEITSRAPDLLAANERAQLAALRARLLEIEREQEDVDIVLPWSVFALGTAALVVGTVLGIERASACDASCQGPFWPSWLVVGGATVGTLGLVWLKLEHEELSALRSRHYHLSNQIEAYELNRASLAPRLRIHGAF